jgi:hypothetical protein
MGVARPVRADSLSMPTIVASVCWFRQGAFGQGAFSQGVSRFSFPASLKKLKFLVFLAEVSSGCTTAGLADAVNPPALGAPRPGIMDSILWA